MLFTFDLLVYICWHQSLSSSVCFRGSRLHLSQRKCEDQSWSWVADTLAFSSQPPPPSPHNLLVCYLAIRLQDLVKEGTKFIKVQNEKEDKEIKTVPSLPLSHPTFVLVCFHHHHYHHLTVQQESSEAPSTRTLDSRGGLQEERKGSKNPYPRMQLSQTFRQNKQYYSSSVASRVSSSFATAVLLLKMSHRWSIIEITVDSAITVVNQHSLLLEQT